jgi:hypothetical protein
MANQNLPEISIVNSTKKSLVLIGIIALFVGAIYAYLITDYMQDEDPSAKSQAVIFVCGPIYVFMLLWGINWAYHPKPVITLKEDYIWWSMPGGTVNMIPWTQIEKFESKHGTLGGAVRVFVKNPERYYSEKFAERRGQERYAAKHGTHISISAELTKESAEEVCAIIQNYFDVVNGKRGARVIPRYSHRFSQITQI